MEALKDILWVEKYRPRDIKDAILPNSIKKTFQKYIKEGQVPNLLLCGTAGTGKTTVARAVLEQLGCEYIMINGSLTGNIETLRVDIKNFASTVSIIAGGRKYVILDEADYLTHHTQPALRNFMEEYSNNCGFILTCNYKSKIIGALQSRCAAVEFRIPKKEKAELAKAFMKRCMDILNLEGIPFDKVVLQQVILKYFPDWRRVLNELQHYSANGSIDSGMLTNFTDASVKKLVELMKERDFNAIRKWVGENADIDSVELFEKLYTHAAEITDQRSIPVLIMHLAKYQYQSSFVALQEINTMACITEIMSDCTFK